MACYRFIHSADLHLGKRFGNFPEGPRERLRQARLDVIPRIAQAARDHGAADVLLAGDTFDAASPDRRTIRHALQAFAAADDVRWWLLPGNHDALRIAEPLWDTLAADAPANLRVLRAAEPVALAEGVTLLPCPVLHRQGATDETCWLAGTGTPAGALRIGLAHGSIASFAEDGRADTIAPDRAASAGLAYLALGDWHGAAAVDARTRYAGTPERDSLRHEGRGRVLAVTLDGPAAPPSVEPVETGRFAWHRVPVALMPEDDAGTVLREALPGAPHGDMVCRVVVSGRAAPAARRRLLSEAGRVDDEFCHFELDVDELRTVCTAADLDWLDGALRAAAEALRRSAGDEAAPPPDRRRAEAAFNLLIDCLGEDA